MGELYWWLVDQLSRTLTHEEREAVRGDFAELDLTGREALRDLLGLVARRQAALWKDWRPWLALLGIALPLGLLLTLSSYAVSGLLVRNLETVWRYGVRYETGLPAGGDAIVIISQAASLALSSWISGFALASLSRRTLWLNGLLFYFVWARPLVVFLEITLYSKHGRALTFFVIFTVLLSSCLFVLPSAWGIRKALHNGTFNLRRVILLAVAVLMIGALALWTGSWWHKALITWSHGRWHLPAYDWQRPALTLALANWPLCYLFVIALRRRSSSSSAAMSLDET